MQPLRIGVYLRVSTDDQVNVFEGSLESQKYRVIEFVRFKNSQSRTPWGEIVDYYVEEGVSAGTTKRSEYQRLMADIRKGRVNMILVSDLTRLSRNLLDFCNLINELEAHKASYLSMKEQFDTSTPIGRMIVYIIIALGQFERETTSERVSMNCHTRAVKGFLNGGPAPLGYDKHPDKKGLLVPNEEEAKIVREIFQIFLEEGSRAKTIPRLHEKRLWPKRTSKRAQERGPADWTVQSLGTFLESVTYIGMRDVNKIYKDEDPARLKPWQRYQVVKASWPGIVDEKVFYDAQRLLEEAVKKERTRQSKSEKRIFLLTGILTCGETGLPLVGQAGHSSNGTVHRYYHYVRKPKDVAVVRPRLNADELEEKVLCEFRDALATQGYFDDLERTLKSISQMTSQTSRAEYERLKKALQENSDRIAMIWANQGRMQLDESALRLASEELNRLAKEQEDLEIQLASIDPIAFDSGASREQALFVENQIRLCLQGWAKAPFSVRKRMLRRVVKEIVVTSDEMHLTFWTSQSEQINSYQDLDGSASESAKNVLSFQRRSPPVQDRNLLIRSSGKEGNGSEGRT